MSIIHLDVTTYVTRWRVSVLCRVSMSWWLIGSRLGCNVCLDSDYLVMLDLEIMAPPHFLVFYCLHCKMYRFHNSTVIYTAIWQPGLGLRLGICSFFFFFLKYPRSTAWSRLQEKDTDLKRKREKGISVLGVNALMEEIIPLWLSYCSGEEWIQSVVGSASMKVFPWVHLALIVWCASSVQFTYRCKSIADLIEHSQS